MRKPGNLTLRVLESPRNGRSARQLRMAAATYRANGWRIPGFGLFRGLGRAIGEILGMAVVLALSIVLAHAMLIVVFTV